MTTGPGTGRVSTSEALRRVLELAEQMAAPRQPSPPLCAVSIGTTAKHATKDGGAAARLHTYDVDVRHEDPNEAKRTAKRLADELDADYAHELEASDNLGAQLAASVVAQQDAKP